MEPIVEIIVTCGEHVECDHEKEIAQRDPQQQPAITSGGHARETSGVRVLQYNGRAHFPLGNERGVTIPAPSSRLGSGG